jgi:hypothetical protein
MGPIQVYRYAHHKKEVAWRLPHCSVLGERIDRLDHGCFSTRCWPDVHYAMVENQLDR